MPLPNWLHPDTDLIASFAPFSNLPTPYKVSVNGRSHTNAQCGLECLAISWLFPGQEIRIDSPCLDCGEPVMLRMRVANCSTWSPRAECWGAIRNSRKRVPQEAASCLPLTRAAGALVTLFPSGLPPLKAMAGPTSELHPGLKRYGPANE